MMMFARFKTSIKRQLFVALASFTLFLCVSYTGVAVLVAYVTEDAVLESILSYEAKALQDHYSKTAIWQQPRATYMQLIPSFTQLPEALKTTVQAANRRNDTRSEVFTKLQTHYHVIRLTTDPQSAYLVAEVSPFLVVNNLSKNLADFMLVVALLMTGGALLLAFRLARRIAAPLLQLNEELKSRIEDKHQVTFSAANRTDEIGFLANTLGQSLQSLQQALKRETLFTRDISHELRTPVTIIKNLLHRDDDATLSKDDRQLLTSSMKEIDHALETLLALARAENLALQEVNLVAHLELAILNLEKTAQTHQLHFTVDMDEAMLDQKYSAMANPHLLNLLFNNLLNNALFHGGDQVIIKISLETCRMVIGNSIAPHAPTHASGFTHGKNLLQRIVHALDWQIDFQSRDNYFEASIKLS
nr:histidine kinase dimerization/phospho-acceptor domain-containing protein [uncultured Undibacterium sp.]